MSRPDVTGWCQREEHTICDGNLRTETGWHWWCACDCHPEPSAIPIEAKQAWIEARQS